MSCALDAHVRVVEYRCAGCMGMGGSLEETSLLVSVRVSPNNMRSPANLHQKNRQNQLYNISHARTKRVVR